MTYDMEKFIIELAELIGKHGIEFDVEQDNITKEAVCIQLTQMSDQDEDGKCIRDLSYASIPKCFDEDRLNLFLKIKKLTS